MRSRHRFLLVHLGLDDTGLYLTAARAVIGNVSHVLIGEWHCSLEEPAEACMEACIVMR